MLGLNILSRKHGIVMPNSVPSEGGLNARVLHAVERPLFHLLATDKFKSPKGRPKVAGLHLLYSFSLFFCSSDPLFAFPLARRFGRPSLTLHPL